MSSVDQFTAALENLRRGYETGRLAHAFLVHGPARGAARTLVESFLQLLFCTAEGKPCGTCAECRRVTDHAHPDVLWLEPESKSRQIVIGEAGEEEGIRKVVRFIALTPFSGQRKAAVIVDADRMNAPAANAFLKTLEEPPASSLLFLLTESPQALLPTIRSRCQTIDLSTVSAAAGPWQAAMLDWLRAGPAADPLRAIGRAGAFKALLAAERERIEAAGDAAEEEGTEAVDDDVRVARISAQYRAVRASMLREMLHWHRDVLLRALDLPQAPFHFSAEAGPQQQQARALSPAAALGDLRKLDTLIRRLEQFPEASEQILLELELPRHSS